MNCFPCFSSDKSKNSNSRDLPVAHATGPGDPPPENGKQKPSAEVINKNDEDNTIDNKNVAAHTFTFRELAAATKNFRQECLVGEGGFGRVYKGTLQPSGQVVAVKQLDRNGMQGNKEFLVEVLTLCLLHHPNLVDLIGYCADGDQRLLVYEYMPLGSVEDHLHGISGDKKPLDWIARMKIASGAAQGLEYLHEQANPPVIYRDLKSSNILMDEQLSPRLSDYGLAKLGLGGSKMHISPRVMGTYGNCAPEYARTGELTLKSDVYSFGVVLLELITGRRAIDTTRPTEEQNLVSWAQPFFKDPRRFPDLADPVLESKFPVKSLNQAVGVAAMCLQEEPSVRPLISDVVTALSFLTVAARDEPSLPVPDQFSQVEISNAPEDQQNRCEERDIIRSSEEQDSDTESDSSSDHDGDHECPRGSKSSDDDDDGDSVEEHQEQDNSRKHGSQVKKSVKWASRCRSKVDTQEGSVRSSSSCNINTESNVERCGQNFNSHSSVKRGSDLRESLDGRYGSNTSHNSNNESRDGRSQDLKSDSNVIKWESNSKLSSKVESQDWSFGSTSSSEFESVDGSCKKNRRSNSNVGPKYGSYGSNNSKFNSRQDSDVGSRDRSIAFEVRSNSILDSEDGSVGSNSRRNSNVDLEDVSVRNSNSRRNSIVESRDGSILSDSSSSWNSMRYGNVGDEEHGNRL